MRQEQIDRINYLRAFYKKGPVFTEWVGFTRARRQRLNYMRALSKNGHLYSYKLRKSYADAYLFDNMEPVINDKELIVGLPDNSPLSEEEQKEYNELEKAMRMFAPRGTDICAAHMALDYEKLVKIGIKGLLSEVRCRLAALDLNIPGEVDKAEFYECCTVELEALVRLQHRYAEKARELAKDADARRREELLTIAEIMDKVPECPASTFREGLQSIHFFNVMGWDLYYFGRVDRYLIDLYREDVKAGRITYEDATELYACFLLLPEAYILPNVALDAMVGGTLENGETVENEVTHIAIDAIEYARSANGKVSLAVTKDMSDELIKKAIRLNAIGCAQPALFNDRIIIEGYIRAGIPNCDAHNYCNTGCVEVTPVGKSGIHVVSPYHNLGAMMLSAMKKGENTESFEEFYSVFENEIHYEIKRRNLDMNRAQMERARNGQEAARISCLIDDCLKRGKPVDAGGGVYNFVEPNFLGFSNAVDSLAAIDTLIYKEKKLTMSELISVLQKDYEGEEALRQYIINRVPHFGTDEEITNKLAHRLANSILSGCEGLYTYRGSTLIPGAFSYWEHATHGKRTGATPDGRHAGYPLCSGSSPVQGREIKGPTAAMLSTLSYDHRDYLGGLAVNMKFTPSCLTADGGEKMLTFVRTFMELGGFQLQLNCVSKDILLAAREHPEEHSDLLVRVGGFSAYFTKLSPEMQQEIIDRNEHEM